MVKTEKWYKAKNLSSRVAREASLADEYNPRCEIVTCKSCGRDTTNPNCLCDNCL